MHNVIYVAPVKDPKNRYAFEAEAWISGVPRGGRYYGNTVNWAARGCASQAGVMDYTIEEVEDLPKHRRK